MRPYAVAIAVLLMLHSVSWAAPPDDTAGCPADIKSAIDSACPCATFDKHGPYMHCVKTQTDELAKNGCDITQIGEATRCAALSTCGQGGVVCCDERGRAKVMPPDSCVATGGTVQSGAASPCDVVCQGTSSGLSAPDRRQRPRHRARHLPPGATATE